MQKWYKMSEDERTVFDTASNKLYDAVCQRHPHMYLKESISIIFDILCKDGVINKSSKERISLLMKNGEKEKAEEEIFKNLLTYVITKRSNSKILSC